MAWHLVNTSLHDSRGYLLFALVALAGTAASTFLYKFGQARMKTYRLRRQGLAMPPLNPIFGHLLVLARIMSRLPKDAHPQYLPDQLRRAYPDLGPIFYIDAWPFLTLTLVLTSPTTMYQVAQERQFPKFPAIVDFLHPLTGGQNIVTRDGIPWKVTRGWYNPGFSVGHLMTLVPAIVEETAVFCRNLSQLSATRARFEMKEQTDNLTIDIIGKIVLDLDLKAQTTENKMVSAFRRQMNWLAFGDEGNLARFNPIRPFVHAYNTMIVDRYISPEIDSRFQIYHKEKRATEDGRQKCLFDLALEAQQREKQANGHTQQDMDDRIEPGFKKMAMSDVKLFLFSGHDTTSSSACYIFYALSQNPAALTRVRAEHDELFGKDPSQAARLLSADPYLVNKLPYTVAVIKETLRLFPAASSTRSGEPDRFITDEQGRRFPTDGCLVWLISQAVQRDPRYWPDADTFLPERWLTESPDDPLHPVKGAWRPFEYGPRACIGVELAYLEMKIIMILTVRAFDLSIAYDDDSRDKAIRTVEGERGYQLNRGQPAGNLPCRVREKHVYDHRAEK